MPRKARGFCVFAAVFCAVVFAAGVALITLGAASAPSAAAVSPDYLILLGGGIDVNGTLPPAVQARVRIAAEYLSAKPETTVVVTGGTLKFLPHPEAPAIKAALVSAGVPSDRIMVEDRALDTIQNFRNSVALVSAMENIPPETVLASDIVVVTSFFHTARALFIAGRLGFSSVSALPVAIPAFYAPQLYLREIGAWAKLFARIAVTGEPSPLHRAKVENTANR